MEQTQPRPARERVRSGSRVRLSRRTKVVTAIAVLGVAGGALGSLTISGAFAAEQAGTYTACQQRSGKIDRVFIGATRNPCGAGQTPLTWNQQGPPGAAGLPGARGAAGPPGPAGPGGPSSPAEGAISGTFTTTGGQSIAFTGFEWGVQREVIEVRQSSASGEPTTRKLPGALRVLAFTLVRDADALSDEVFTEGRNGAARPMRIDVVAAGTTFRYNLVRAFVSGVDHEAVGDKVREQITIVAEDYTVSATPN